MLPKKYRLTKKKDFAKVFKKGRIFAEQFVVVKTHPNNLEFSRFGFVVGVKIDKKATQRNKIRRQLQEIIRVNLGNIRVGLDVVFLPKKEIIGKNFQEITSATKKILAQLN